MSSGDGLCPCPTTLIVPWDQDAKESGHGDIPGDHPTLTMFGVASPSVGVEGFPSVGPSSGGFSSTTCHPRSKPAGENYVGEDHWPGTSTVARVQPRPGEGFLSSKVIQVHHSGEWILVLPRRYRFPFSFPADDMLGR